MYLVDFVKKLFTKGNIGIIIYLILNIFMYILLLGGFGNIVMAFFAILLYLVTLALALSPVGEFILRIQTGCKKIKRRDYLERIMPLFERVYSQAKAKNPNIADGIKIYMNDDSDPNAFATGRKTICITKGFITYSDDQIMGVLAHEFAHLANKDTDLLLLISVGNFLMSAIFIIYRIIINLIIFFIAVIFRMRFVGTFLTSLFINLILTFFMWVWTKIGTLLVLHSSRKAEFAADKYAFDIAYGNDLCAVLDSFDSGNSKKGLFANLHASHPDTSDRIAALQDLGASYRNSYGLNVKPVYSVPQLQYESASQQQNYIPPHQNQAPPLLEHQTNPPQLMQMPQSPYNDGSSNARYAPSMGMHQGFAPQEQPHYQAVPPQQQMPPQPQQPQFQSPPMSVPPVPPH